MLRARSTPRLTKVSSIVATSDVEGRAVFVAFGHILEVLASMEEEALSPAQRYLSQDVCSSAQLAAAQCYVDVAGRASAASIHSHERIFVLPGVDKHDQLCWSLGAALKEVAEPDVASSGRRHCRRGI